MTVNMIMSGFCERKGIAYDPENGDGTIALRVGDGNVLIVPDAASDELNVFAVIGEQPVEGGEACERQMLEENFRLAASCGACLSFDSASKSYVVGETVAAEGLEVEALQKIIADVAALRDLWRGKLKVICSDSSAESDAVPPVGAGVIHA